MTTSMCSTEGEVYFEEDNGGHGTDGDDVWVYSSEDDLASKGNKG